MHSENETSGYVLTRAVWNDYLVIARVDHWFKNILMVPGIILGIMMTGTEGLYRNALLIPIGILSACLIASANYVANEWLDREFDRFHPVKRNRRSVTVGLRPGFVLVEYFSLASSGLIMSLACGTDYATTTLILLVMGVLYNVQPFRTKDRAYLDVLSESINNPIRLVLGWQLIASHGFPPSSIVLSYWMAGAFLMSIKRFAEYRRIGDPDMAARYRRSFATYTERALLASSLFYTILSALFIGVFLMKHRTEYIAAFPFIGVVFTQYFLLGMRDDSPVQYPERLYREGRFFLWTMTLSALLAFLSLVDLPFLYFLRY